MMVCRKLAVFGFVLLTLGGATATAAVVVPHQVEQTYGQVKMTVDNLKRTVTRAVTEQVAEVTGQEPPAPEPDVTLGATGGTAELDACDGTFTEMLSYENGQLPPVWAAHNNCGGDVVLSWEPGQTVRINDGESISIYRVVDVRTTPKVWATTDDLTGLSGELVLQSCFYGEDRMRFVGLAKA